MYQLAIFDLDGTLVNSIADLGGTANHLLEQRHLPTHPIDAYYHFVGNGVHKLCERCLPPDTPAAEVETFFAEFNDYYSRHCLDKTAPYDGIPAVLAQLKAAGVHLAVASNKTQPFVETIVRHYFGSDCFDQIFGSSDDRPKKPAPTWIFRQAKMPACIPLAASGDSAGNRSWNVPEQTISPELPPISCVSWRSDKKRVCFFAYFGKN